MQITFDQLLQLLERLITVIAFLMIYHSVPAGKVKELLDSADRASQKTETPVDNALVEIAKLFYGMLPKSVNTMDGEAPSEAPLGTQE